MMQYYTQVDIPPIPQKISHQQHIMLMGSCFSTHIAAKLKWHLFNVLENPFGVLYNPASIEQSISIIKQKRIITKDDFFLDEDVYKSFLFHSQLADTNINNLLNKVNNIVNEAYNFLVNSKWLFITLGTAYVFELVESTEVVANCHKQHSKKFRHRMLSLDEVVEKLHKIQHHIWEISPNSNIVYTVSPVRHLKQGAHLNQISKSTLLLAIEQMLKDCNQAYYFPSYEIFMDELRDYRYYAYDMLHPSDLGIEHVWNRFSLTFFDKETQELNKQILEVKLALEHQPLFPESKSYIRFQAKLEQKINQIKAKVPYLNF